MYIYQCLQKDERFTPPIFRTVCEKPTEKEAIEYLENNGGGIYRNLLHQFDCGVKGKTDGKE